MEPRQWQIVFHLHGDGTATVRIQVNGRLLMPGCAGLPVEEALGYVEAALIDCHAADQLSLRTQGSVGSIRSFRPTDAARGQIWLRERVAELVRALAVGAGDAADSGVRPGLRQQDEARRARSSGSDA
jgi:hypothetical protein